MKTKKQKNDVAASFRSHGSNVNNLLISSKKYCIYFSKKLGSGCHLTGVRAVVDLSPIIIKSKCQALRSVLHPSNFIQYIQPFTFHILHFTTYHLPFTTNYLPLTTYQSRVRDRSRHKVRRIARPDRGTPYSQSPFLV